MAPRNPRAAATKKVFHLLEYMVGIGFGGLVPLEMWRFLLVNHNPVVEIWHEIRHFFLMLKCFVVDVEDSRLLSCNLSKVGVYGLHN